MSRGLHLLLFGALAFSASSFAAVELQPGESIAIELAPGSFSNAVFVDVPANAERLTVRLLANSTAHDVDLLARFEQAFPDTTHTDAPPDAEWLLKLAHFQSVSPGHDESFVITRASQQPLRAGRLFLSLINYSSQAAPATVSATLGGASEFVPLEVVFDDSREDCGLSGWQDSTPATPVRGNSGTTLGEQRRLALLEAARLLSEELRPQAPIRIQSCWGERDYEADVGGTLAFAGPRFLLVDDRGAGLPFAPLDGRYTVHFAPAAAHQAGTAFCRLASDNCGSRRPEIQATFNLKVDQVGPLNQRFDYGFQHASGKISFLTTAMHEIGHGLGFIGWLKLDAEHDDGSAADSEIGDQLSAFGQRYDDAYGRHAAIIADGSTRSLLRANRQERRAALTSLSNLRFDGPRARSAANNLFLNFAPPENLPRLHAPRAIEPGSTYSHLVASHSGQMMTASISSTGPRTLGLAKEMLFDIGWDPTAKTAPAPANSPEGQYFDIARNGHGFDLRRIALIDGIDDLYYLLFYSYDAQGRPEWYSSAGRIIDGAFQPARSSTGDSLLRNLYLGRGQQPSTIADPSPGFNGEVRIDFVDAGRHPACTDGVAGRPLEGPLAILSWEVDGVARQWCTQPLASGRDGVAVDFSSQWHDPTDGGWGLSMLSFAGDGADGIGMQLYYPDATGRGRWGLLQTAQLMPGVTYPVYQVNGYCRTCNAPEQLDLQQIGSMTLSLFAPGEGDTRISIDVTYPGPEGGHFVRTNVAIEPIGAPGFRLP